MPKNKLKTALANALNYQLTELDPATESEQLPSLPEWVPLAPEGVFEGRDGRRFLNQGSQAIINWIVNTNKKDIQWDTSHASELRAPFGEHAPAYAWTKANQESFKIEDGQLFGRVEWNYNGEWVIRDKQMRYYSPVFIVSKEIDKETNAQIIIGITSIGLTNEPNLYVPALNQKTNHTNQEANPMDLSKLIAALGLESSTATLDDCVTAVNAMKSDHVTALNNKQPDMEQFSLRSELNTALNRATTAEQKLADRDADTLKNDIEATLNAAQTEGKITPATRDYYTEMCQQENGLQKFNDFIKTAPVVVSPDSELNGKSPEGTSTVLNAAEKHTCAQLGLTEEQFLVSKKELV